MKDPTSSDWTEAADGPGVIVLMGRDEPGFEFRLGTRDYGWHQHVRGQLLCVESGMLHVRTEDGSWMLPPHRAGWIPPGRLHRVGVYGVMRGWTVLVAPQVAAALSTEPRVVVVTDLMRALVRRAVDWSVDRNPEDDRQAEVLLDEIGIARAEGLHLPMPSDPRLVRITTTILAQPDDHRTIDEWAAWGGMSARSLRRLIAQETGLNFGQWRRQARLMLALEDLAQGLPVGGVSDRLGYESPSSFIAMFKRSFGVTPGQLFAPR